MYYYYFVREPHFPQSHFSIQLFPKYQTIFEREQAIIQTPLISFFPTIVGSSHFPCFEMGQTASGPDEEGNVHTPHRFHHGKLRGRFTKRDFQAARGADTVESALATLSRLGRDLRDIDPSKLDLKAIGPTNRVCFILANTYTTPGYQLGPGPLNDSISVALGMRRLRHRVCFLHNADPNHFMKWLRFLFLSVQDSLVFYYTGHGISVKDRNGDEADGLDEAILFDKKRWVTDDELGDYLKRYKKVQRLVLLADCCHSGTLWDIPEPGQPLGRFQPGVVSISAAADAETAKQTKLKEIDQGLFTYYFWEFLEENPEITVNGMAAAINAKLSEFNQQCTLATTSPEMLDAPIFPV
jgi:hypothetical protein